MAPALLMPHQGEVGARRSFTCNIGRDRLDQAVSTNYLHGCFRAFDAVIERKYGRRFDLAAIEKSLRHLQGKSRLCYSDLQCIEASQHWWFEKFWIFPPEHKVTEALKRRIFDFWNLPKRENDTIEGLFCVLKSIELVSIVLRFIKPEKYGIISPPVERTLDVRRGSAAIETYLNYLADLRSIQQHYGLARVADADMALWVIHEKCFSEPRDNEVFGRYHSDQFLLRLRAKNLMENFVQQYSYEKLARALAPFNPRLAVQIGGIAFERMVREIASALPDDKLADMDLKTVIDQIHNNKIIDGLTLAKWHAARRIRNQAIHGREAPGACEIRILLEQLE